VNDRYPTLSSTFSTDTCCLLAASSYARSGLRDPELGASRPPAGLIHSVIGCHARIP
jgi:hypothetical protein